MEKKNDNRSKNLEWVSPSKNLKHAYEHNLRKRKLKPFKLNEEIKQEILILIKEGIGTDKIAKILNMKRWEIRYFKEKIKL